MKENIRTEMGRAQSDRTSLTLACRNGLERKRGREREGEGEREREIQKERDIYES